MEINNEENLEFNWTIRLDYNDLENESSKYSTVYESDE